MPCISVLTMGETLAEGRTMLEEWGKKKNPHTVFIIITQMCKRRSRIIKRQSIKGFFKLADLIKACTHIQGRSFTQRSSQSNLWLWKIKALYLWILFIEGLIFNSSANGFCQFCQIRFEDVTANHHDEFKTIHMLLVLACHKDIYKCNELVRKGAKWRWFLSTYLAGASFLEKYIHILILLNKGDFEGCLCAIISLFHIF